jgi:hypothetical protein
MVVVAGGWGPNATAGPVRPCSAHTDSNSGVLSGMAAPAAAPERTARCAAVGGKQPHTRRGSCCATVTPWPIAAPGTRARHPINRTSGWRARCAGRCAQSTALCFESPTRAPPILQQRLLVPLSLSPPHCCALTVAQPTNSAISASCRAAVAMFNCSWLAMASRLFLLAVSKRLSVWVRWRSGVVCLCTMHGPQCLAPLRL